MNNSIFIISQAFYGNRTGTEISIDHIDSFILGHQDGYLWPDDKVDRTVLPLPGTSCVLIYNQFAEKERLEDKARYFREDGYVMKPLAVIPEFDIEVYSRCIVCGITSNGEYTDFTGESKAFSYLAK